MKIGILNEMLDNILCTASFAEDVMVFSSKNNGNPAKGEMLSFDWQVVRNMPVSLKFNLGKVCFVDRVEVECSKKTELTELIVKDSKDTLYTYRAQTNKTIIEKSIVLEAGSLTDNLELVLTCDFSDLEINNITFYGAFDEKVDIFPTPNVAFVSEKSVDALIFDTFVTNTDKAKKACFVLKEKYEELTGVNLIETEGGKIVFLENSSVKADGYKLSVKENCAVITASNERGFVMGAECFIKLCDSKSVTLAEIDDEPMCQFRGVHLYVPGYANL